ncbi:MAG: sigma-54-dependent Fis family transcriptional regulator, partial [Candidatus Cloacimonetes bacterium]|nr:sigma-54-dependent Fis family transcriptional regulator [Candidatus Cloacimonadota bacterium]
GHTKGACTSADKYKIGFFEECSEGILFLDEVTNLSMPAQSKILRSIENKEIQVVGGSLKKVNTRLIFASNAPISDLSSPQTFRKDLFYRIEGNIVELPPLRERGNDIILLISYFITNYSEKYGFSDHSNLSELRDILLSYSWPGNIRELKNFCKFIMISEKEINNDVIIKHLNNKIYKYQDESSLTMNKYFMQGRIRDSMYDYERDYLIFHLSRHNWNVSQTSRSIGLERTTLYKKMKLMNIETPDFNHEQ